MTGCQASVSQKGSVALRDISPDKNKLKWKWRSTATVPLTDFGDPTASTDYILCLYDNTGLQLSWKAPAAGTCAGKPCWAAGTVGFKYKDKELTPDGLSSVSLKSGAAGKAKIGVGGKGANLHLPATLSLTTPVRVQLKRSGSNACWEGTFSNPSRNRPDAFAGKSD